MGWEDVPDDVKKAIEMDDREALSRMGKKGAKTRKRNAELRKADEEDYNIRMGIEHTYRQILNDEGEEAAEEYLKSVEE